MPAEPGEYELRYSFRDKETIHSRPITITAIEVNLTAPESAAAGSEIEIGWTGPNAEGDNIQIAPVGGRYLSWKYTKSGNPVKLKMPEEPGTYELRYSFRDKEVLHSRPIMVTPAE